MTSPNVSFSTGGQSNTANIFDEYRQSLTQIFVQLQDQVNSIHWTGDARGIFNQAMSQWTDEYNTIMADLGQMSELMGSTANHYQNLAGNAASSASALRNSLPGF